MLMYVFCRLQYVLVIHPLSVKISLVPGKFGSVGLVAYSSLGIRSETFIWRLEGRVGPWERMEEGLREEREEGGGGGRALRESREGGPWERGL